jgi:hypothetical protein
MKYSAIARTKFTRYQTKKEVMIIQELQNNNNNKKYQTDKTVLNLCI